MRAVIPFTGGLLFFLLSSETNTLSQAPPKDPFGPRPEPGLRGALVFEEKSKLPLPKGYKLLYEQTFDEPSALKDFVFTDAKAWKISQDEKSAALELVTQSKYEPKARSPLNIALIADKIFGDFILEVDLLSTKEPYGHQDMCIFFGFVGPTQFYYNHIAVAADPNAHNLFIVNDAPRKNFAKETTKGITWNKNQWHKVRLERKISDGTIKVFFDDMTKPIMRGEEKTFGTASSRWLE